MMHDPSYVDTLRSDQQINREFISSKGNRNDTSLLRLLRLGLTVDQVERYIKDEVRQHFFMLKSNTFNSGRRYLLPSLCTAIAFSVCCRRLLAEDCKANSVIVGSGEQTFTVCGDFGLFCGVYVVPDTALSWVKKAMTDVIERHQWSGVGVPRSLYVDCESCGGKGKSSQSTPHNTGTSVAAM